MTPAEIEKYLPYAKRDANVMLIDRATYERLMCKAKILDAVRKQLNEVYKAK